MDRSGNVVGIVSGKLNTIQVAETTSETTENVNFAVNLGTIQSFLDSHAVPYVSNDSTQSTTPRSPPQLCATQFCLSAQDSRKPLAVKKSKTEM